MKALGKEFAGGQVALREIDLQIEAGDFVSLVGRMLSDPIVWLGAAAGATYLIWLWRKYLAEAGAVRRFLKKDGRVEIPAR